jgi:hypothetical protein
MAKQTLLDPSPRSGDPPRLLSLWLIAGLQGSFCIFSPLCAGTRACLWHRHLLGPRTWLGAKFQGLRLAPSA